MLVDIRVDCSATEVEILVAEVGVTVLNASEHHVGKCIVETNADGVAIEGFLHVGNARDFRIAASIGPACGTVYQCTVKCVSDPAANRTLPVKPVVEACAENGGGIIAPVLFEVSLKANDPAVAKVIVEADETAGESAVEVCGRFAGKADDRSVIVVPAVTCLDTGGKSGPAEQRRNLCCRGCRYF